MKQRFLTYIFLLSVFSSYSEEKPGGLLFTSSKEKVDERTSLVIFDENLQQFQDSFKLSFDLSIHDMSQFGHIFRIINSERKELEFVFVNFFGLDEMYLDFHSPITHQSVKIPITKEDIDSKKLMHLDFVFDLIKDKVIIQLDDRSYICESVGLENPSLVKLAFGIFGLNLDVPQMLVKNIKIEDRFRVFSFPLNESTGNYAYESYSGRKAFVKNPNWIINNHHYWQEKIQVEFNDNVSITYDEDKNRILIITNDEIISYCPRYEKIEPISLNFGYDFKLLDAIYNPIDKNYNLFYDTRLEEPFYSQLENHNLNLNFASADFYQAIHYSSFISSFGDIYQFGGHANHLYYNHILKYNPNMDSWLVEDFTGDPIIPRFYSSVGMGVNQNEVLLYGGFGNETGRQEHGGRNLYDLYKLNLNTKEIVKLWELQEIPKDEFIAGENLILNEAKTHFYTLCYAHHKPNTTGFIYKFDLENGDYQIISDTLHFQSEGMNTSVKLFYNELIKEFYVVIKELKDNQHSKVSIHSIAAPPIGFSALKSTPKTSWLQWLLIILFASTFLIILLYIYSRIKTRKKSNEVLLDNINIASPSPIEKQTKSAIYVFGDFTVYDSKSKDISYRFSSKIRTLFSLVLLYARGETGITTENLTLVLWPEKELNEAKNIRGVTINRLRNILNDIEGIKLVHKNQQWFFVYEEPFYCDYLEYLELLEKIKHEKNTSNLAELMIRFSEVISSGNLLTNMQEIEIDEFKAREDEKIAVLLKEYLFQLYKKKNYHEVIQLSSTFFKIEPVNDEVLDICLKSYRKLGKQDEGRGFLSRYKRTYEMLTGEKLETS